MLCNLSFRRHGLRFAAVLAICNGLQGCYVLPDTGATDPDRFVAETWPVYYEQTPKQKKHVADAVVDSVTSTFGLDQVVWDDEYRGRKLLSKETYAANGGQVYQPAGAGAPYSTLPVIPGDQPVYKSAEEASGCDVVC